MRKTNIKIEYNWKNAGKRGIMTEVYLDIMENVYLYETFFYLPEKERINTDEEEKRVEQVNLYVGAQIRRYRKNRQMTLQQLADRIHKSRASVSKYETGEVTLDIVTLTEIARVLEVQPGQLVDLPSAGEEIPQIPSASSGISPFFQARRLYFYYYDGRYRGLKDGIIDIRETKEAGDYEADLCVSSVNPSGRSRKLYYTGKVVYSDMLIRFSFVNRYNPLEEDLLYIFNPLELRDSTGGLLCGISSADLMPCAFKCLVTLRPQEQTEEFKKRLLITRRELQQWQKLNMLMVDNIG